MNPDNNNILILGAGASMDYGFPSGERLIKDILGLLEPLVSYFPQDQNQINDDKLKYQQASFLNKLAVLWVIADEENLRNLILNEISPVNKHINIHHVLEMIKKFQTRLNFSGPYSIDDFIAQNPNLAVFSKICIAICISEYEKKEDSFFANLQENKYEITRGWYQWLWGFIYKNMSQNTTKEQHIQELKERFKKLKFITFNYERSLERFLFLRLNHFYGLTEVEVSNILSDTTIHHVYGQLGTIHEKENHIKSHYAPLLELLKSINIDANQPHEDIFKIKDHIEKDKKNLMPILNVAEQIKTYSAESTISFPQIIQNFSIEITVDYYFFGFSYNETNMNLLKKFSNKFIPSSNFQSDKCNIQVFGTTVNLPKNEKKRAEERLKNIFPKVQNIKLGEPDQKIEDFINSI